MSHVESGAVLTLVVPLALLVVILAIWAFERRRFTQRRERGDAG